MPLKSNSLDACVGENYIGYIYIYIYMYIKDIQVNKRFIYFSYFRIPKESHDLSDCDLEVCINNLDKLRKDFMLRFEDLDNMHFPEWLAAAFNVKKDNEGYEFYLEDEVIEMHVDLKAKALFKGKDLSEYWSNVNTAT